MTELFRILYDGGVRFFLLKIDVRQSVSHISSINYLLIDKHRQVVFEQEEEDNNSE
jgi:hypothetical protein